MWKFITIFACYLSVCLNNLLYLLLIHYSNIINNDRQNKPIHMDVIQTETKQKNLIILISQ